MSWFRRSKPKPPAGQNAPAFAFADAFEITRAALTDSTSPSVAPELRESALEIPSGDSNPLFTKLNRLKAERAGLLGTDLLRALCFLKSMQEHAAIEALKEEIRIFPGNQAARVALEKLSARVPVMEAKGDAEFQEILAAVRPYTMVWPPRLESLYQLAKEVCEEDVPGNFVECGVAAGGTSALLAAVIARHSKRPRTLFAFDTFEGMPAADGRDTHSGTDATSIGWGEGTCAAPEDSLREAARKVGAEHVIEPVKGLFSETLPRRRDSIGEIAFLHMDGDWYSSTRDILVNLFDSLGDQARIQIDDYGFWDGCKRAVTEFAAERNLQFDLRTIDETGVWMRKPKGSRAPEKTPAPHA